MEVLPRFDLNGQVALVTGAARGLGRAISLALAAAGADVALGLRDINADGGLPAEIRALGRRVLPVQMDMTRLDQITRAIDYVVRDFGRLDILVNNAGVAPSNRAEDVPEADFDFTLAVNLKGTFFCLPGRGPCDDRPEEWSDHQYELAGWIRRSPQRIHLLHDQSWHRAPNKVPRGGMGLPQHHSQCSSTHVHSYAGDPTGSCGFFIPSRRHRSHCRA